MAFSHHYPNRKDWRKPYYRRGRYDRTCRPHGGCPYCRSSRLYQALKAQLSADEQLEDLAAEEKEP